MKIEKITRQVRRDFSAIYKCEHCQYKLERGGYDDEYFHRNVIPNIECPACGKKSPDDYRPLTTKYPPDQVV